MQSCLAELSLIVFLHSHPDKHTCIHINIQYEPDVLAFLGLVLFENRCGSKNRMIKLCFVKRDAKYNLLNPIIAIIQARNMWDQACGLAAALWSRLTLCPQQWTDSLGKLKNSVCSNLRSDSGCHIKQKFYLPEFPQGLFILSSVKRRGQIYHV